MRQKAQETKPELAPTPEQEAFCESVWSGKPCWLSARAGTGKTSTIKLAFQLAPQPLDCTVVAFNKKNQEDLSKALGPDVKVATLHSLGFAALRNFMPGLQIEPSKLFELTKTADLKRGPRVFSDTMRLVSCAKNWGLVPKRDRGAAWKASILPDTPESWLALQDHFELWEADLEAARDILKRSNEQFWQERKLDFDDMVYLPVALGLQVFSSPKMIVDEAQDLSPLNLKMLSKTPAKVWYVGDPYQAIYSWRGAAEDTLGLLGLPELPLTVCWRCAKNIISEAQFFVPDIKARPDAPAGQVQKLDWMPDWKKHPAGTILSRTNAALISIALELQKSGQRVCIIGKDVGATLLGILAKFKGQTQKALEGQTKDWLREMTEKYPHRQGELEDYAKALLALIHMSHGKGEIERKIQGLFTDQEQAGSWILSTIHKAKGREWPSVWLLDWEGKNLNQPWQKREDRNLRYVARTRAKEFLGIISERSWNSDLGPGMDWRALR